MDTSKRNIKRIAVMGGTFDPIHMGHLVTAEAVRHEYAIDEVVFVPTGNPPHKSSVSITSAEHRYLMTVLATAANEHFHVSRIEIDRKGTTYTVDTIKELQTLYGKNTEIYFITGADAIHEILTWKNSEELLTLCTFVAVTRPGYKKQALMEKVEELKNKYNSPIKFLEVPALSISSSEIRYRVKDQRPIKYLVTSSVENYIGKHHLYSHPLTFNQEIIKKLSIYVKKELSNKRYEHTKGVMERAIELGNIHKVNVDKLFIAALFHDVAKELPPEQLKHLCDCYDIVYDFFEREHPQLLHGKVGAALLKYKWGIEDQEVLDSIAYHTIGREGMSNMEKIIYLADMTEKGRRPFPGIEKIRRLSEVDLDCAMYEALKASKHYVCEIQQSEIHPITHQLIRFYEPKDVRCHHK